MYHFCVVETSNGPCDEDAVVVYCGNSLCFFHWKEKVRELKIKIV